MMIRRRGTDTAAAVIPIDRRTAAGTTAIRPGQTLGYLSHYGRAIQLVHPHTGGPYLRASLLGRGEQPDRYEAYDQREYSDIGAVILKECQTPYIHFIAPTTRTPKGAQLVAGLDGVQGVELVKRVMEVFGYVTEGAPMPPWTGAVMNPTPALDDHEQGKKKRKAR